MVINGNIIAVLACRVVSFNLAAVSFTISVYLKTGVGSGEPTYLAGFRIGCTTVVV
jgi:hypothetical protein